MPFDTIFGPVSETSDMPEMWAHHIKNRRLAVPNIKPDLKAVAIPALALIFMGASFRAAVLPQDKVAASERKEVKAATDDAKNTAKVIGQGVEVESYQPLSPLSKTEIMNSLAVYRMTSRGGYEKVYQAAAKKYGVPWQLIAAIHFVETGQSGDTDVTNQSGATGPMQFMPSTFAAYATDGDGDGKANIYDVHDAIYTAAKNLAANHATQNPRGALYLYNHSNEYVERVLGYARGLGYTK